MIVPPRAHSSRAFDLLGWRLMGRHAWIGIIISAATYKHIIVPEKLSDYHSSAMKLRDGEKN